MLLERFGLWDARSERVAALSRGMAQRLALCRALLHEPELLILDEPHSALDAEGMELLDRELAELRAACDVSRCDPRPRPARRPRECEPRARVITYVHDAARSPARICCSSCAVATRCRRWCSLCSAGSCCSTSRVPADATDRVTAGLLWVVILFTALLGLVRAFVAEREQRLMDGLLLAPCDRSAIWFGKSSPCSRSSRPPRSSRCPRSRCSSVASAGRRSPAWRLRTSASPPSARCSPRWRR